MPKYRQTPNVIDKRNADYKRNQTAPANDQSRASLNKKKKFQAIKVVSMIPNVEYAG